MKKRMLAILLTLCAILTLLPFGASAAGFQDVKPDAYYYHAVDWAVNHDPQITNSSNSYPKPFLHIPDRYNRFPYYLCFPAAYHVSFFPINPAFQTETGKEDDSGHGSQ